MVWVKEKELKNVVTDFAEVTENKKHGMTLRTMPTPEVGKQIIDELKEIGIAPDQSDRAGLLNGTRVLQIKLRIKRIS